MIEGLLSKVIERIGAKEVVSLEWEENKEEKTLTILLILKEKTGDE